MALHVAGERGTVFAAVAVVIADAGVVVAHDADGSLERKRGGSVRMIETKTKEKNEEGRQPLSPAINSP